MKIGFIGLGIMGKPMAKNLLKAGFEVWVNNRSRAPMDELAQCGAHPGSRKEPYNHAIAESVPGTPVLLYNNPGRVGYTMTAGLADELAHSVPNIVGMKDTSGDITQTSEFIRRTRDVDFKVFGGKDTLLYASMCHGAVGGVCTAANFMPDFPKVRCFHESSITR